MSARARRSTPARPARSEAPARRPRAARGPFHGPWLFLGGLALCALAAWLEGPVVVRQVSNVVSMRRVESHAPLLLEASRESGVDACMLAAVMYVESRGQRNAVSNKGALGLLQLMPPAASDAAKRLKLAEPTREALLGDARLNVRLGANHLATLSRSLGVDPERTLVAYNAGRGRLLEWEKAAGGWQAWRDRHARAQDSPTLRYAQDVVALAQRFRERGVIAKAAAEESSSSRLAETLAPDAGVGRGAPSSTTSANSRSGSSRP